MSSFHDRARAGRALAARLSTYRFLDPIVLALPPGGVPVAAEVARALGAPLEVLVVRKLVLPGHVELGMGAVAETGEIYVDGALVADLEISAAQVETALRVESEEVRRRVKLYRGGQPLPELAGRTVIVVDDGIATGGTARVALRALRALGAKRLVMAVPVAAEETVRALEGEADELVCLLRPRNLVGIGLWYADFHRITDDEVLALLAARGAHAASAISPVFRA